MGTISKKRVQLLIVFLLLLLVIAIPRTALANWQYIGTPGFSSEAIKADMFVYQGTPYVAVVEKGSNNSASLTVMKYENGNWQGIGSPRFCAAALWAEPYIFVDSGIPYVAFGNEVAPRLHFVSVMKYAGGSWQYVGEPNIGAVYGNGKIIGGMGSPMGLFVDHGTPYLTYFDYGHSYIAKYTNGSWEKMGNTVEIENKKYLPLFVDKGIPYVAFMSAPANVASQNASSPKKYMIAVHKYDGGSWKSLGDTGAIPSDTNSISIAVDQGIPYVAYTDVNHENRMTVIKYESDSWQTVGSPGFSFSKISQPCICMDQGTPYVIFYAAGNGQGSKHGVTVMKYAGRSWQMVGNLKDAGLSTISLSIDQGTPYVLFDEYAQKGGKGISAMKYLPEQANNSLNATVTSFKLFEGPDKLSDSFRRVYQDTFLANTVRYIYWEIATEFPDPGARIPVSIKAVFYTSTGEVKGEQKVDSFIENGWTAANLWKGFGSDKASSWLPGSYKVVIYVNGQELASKNFTVIKEQPKPVTASKKAQPKNTANTPARPSR